MAIFYGLAAGLSRIFDDYRRQRQAIYCDLGYWTRRCQSRFDGYHKLCLNSRHPTDYFQNRPHGPERFAVHGVEIAPWRKPGRGHVLVAGMSAKAAMAEGLTPHAWEVKAIQQLRKLTKRPIIYRPKPNWAGARPIAGSIFQKDAPLEAALRGCHAVVTHHSNVAVDALLAGVPCICFGGAASLLSGNSLVQIENPPMPEGREQWAWDLAWTQWSVEEIERGDAYRYIDGELLA